MTKSQYTHIIDNDYTLDQGTYDETFLKALVDLGHPDPELRDELALPVLTDWILQSKIGPSCKVTALEELLGPHYLFYCLGDNEDKHALKRTFSALVIAALLQADYERSYLTAESVRLTRQKIIEYMNLELVETGFHETYGWVHAKAHGADVVRQLFISPKLTDLEKVELSNLLVKLLYQQKAPFLWREDERLCKAVLSYQGEDSSFQLRHLENLLDTFYINSIDYQRKNILVRYLQNVYFFAKKRQMIEVVRFCEKALETLMSWID